VTVIKTKMASKQKMPDFDDNEGFDSFKVNEDFKSKFEYKERRKHLEQGRLKYGDMLNYGQEVESEESSSSDDSEAELVNPKFEKKFLEVITKIRAKDKSIQETKGDLWKDDDFDDAPAPAEKDKKMTLKDQIRRDALKKIREGASASENDSDDGGMFKKKGVPLAEEQRKIK